MGKQTATTVADQQVLVDQWIENAPMNTVIVEAEYSPNGSPSQREEWVNDEQCGPELCDDFGEPVWDSVTLSEDGLTLYVQSCPQNSKHTYETYVHTPSEEVTGDRMCEWDDLDSLHNWLTNSMMLTEDSKGYKDCMISAMEDAIEQMK